jgi:probable rRNA maturation factor
MNTTTPIELVITTQRVDRTQPTPPLKQLREWCEFTLRRQKIQEGELCLRIVGPTEIHQLNKQYRHQNKATNVLSFPALPLPDTKMMPLLGDLVICAAVVNREAREQGKSRAAHWAHMVIHGTLHLLGFDHLQPADADIMEAREIYLLKQLGFPNPYQ